MVDNAYNSSRDISADYLSTVRSWIESSGEVLVVLRYLAAAGAKDFALVRSAAQFEQLVQVCPIGTDIVVFRDPQLRLRGIVDDALIKTAMLQLREWREYLYVVLKPPANGDARLFSEMGDEVQELIDSLSEHTGESIAIGPCPNFIAEDNEAMISRAKGGIDGPR